MATADEKVRLLLDILYKVSRDPSFKAPAYAGKIAQAAYSTEAMQHFDDGYVRGDLSFSGTVFDGQNCERHIEILAAATFARALSNIADGHGFAKRVKKDEALLKAKKSVTALTSFCYGDYLNQQIAKEPQLGSLGALKNDEAFVDAFSKSLGNLPFKTLSEMYDQANSNHQYSTSLLFTHQYLRRGPGFTMEGTVEEANNNRDTWLSILQNWIVNAGLVQGAARGVVQGHMVRALCGALMQNGVPDTSTDTLYQKVHDTLDDDDMENISTDLQKQLEVMQHLGHSVWNAWEAKLDEFTAAMRAALDHGLEKVVIGPLGGTKVTVYGDPVIAFMEDFKDLGLFDGIPSDAERSTTKKIRLP